MLPDSYEQTLLFIQHEKGMGLFACDGMAIYSNKLIKVAPGAVTRIVNSDLKCRMGGEFHTAMNTDIFLAVWRKVYSDGQFWAYHWTLKADPDTVFFPSRLYPLLQKYGEMDTPHGIYLNNCKYGLHGPIEIFSRKAVQALQTGAQRCKHAFQTRCGGKPCAWGEDMFIDQCLWKVLDVKREDSFKLLLEDHCDPPKGWDECRDPATVAFHPFKKAEKYSECVDNAQSEVQHGHQSTIHHAPAIVA
jgi:hypothetical protein